MDLFKKTSLGATLFSEKIISGGAFTQAFIFEVVTAGADTFQLPIYNGGTYDFNVDWGDGNDDDITTWNDAATNHSYVGAGTYKVSITGTINGWRFNNAGDKTLIHDISAWGSLLLGNNNGYFYGCSNLTVSATDVLDTSAITTLENGFRSCTSLIIVPSMDSWDVSFVTNMGFTFYGATLFNQDIGSWDVSAVTTLTHLFYNTAFDQDIGSWDVSAVTSLINTFAETPFNQDINSWDVSAVTTLNSTFYRATLFNQDIGSWDVSAVTTLRYLFYKAATFNQDISSWDVSSVTNMEQMFRETPFDQNIGSWVITLVTIAANMFDSSTLSTANYDALLIGWEAQVEQPNVTFHGGNSKYSAGAAATARAALVANGWTITDGGQV